MASSGIKPVAGDPGVPGQEGVSSFPQPEFLASFQHPSQVLGLAAAPVVTQNRVCSLPRNVISERERRKRISVSCEHLRALLPQFDGRREDMASVLEMAVQFLQLAHNLVPDREQLSVSYKQVPAPSQESWCMQQGDVLQLIVASQMADSKPDPGTAASGVTLLQDPSPCGMLSMDQGETLGRPSELLERPPSIPEPGPGISHEGQPVSSPAESSSLGPGVPSWLSHSWQSPSPEMREDVTGGLHQAEPLAREDASPGRLAEEASEGLTPVPDIRYAAGAIGCDVENEMPFLLTTSPDWWVGSGSVDGRGGPVLSRSSPVDRTELGFLLDPEPGSEELQAGPLEPWGLDLGSWGLPLKDEEEENSIFPDLFTC